MESDYAKAINTMVGIQPVDYVDRILNIDSTPKDLSDPEMIELIKDLKNFAVKHNIVVTFNYTKPESES